MGHRGRIILGAATAVLCASGSAPADWVTQQIGWDALVERLGAGNIPTGAGIVVGQVEASSGGNYMPDVSDAEFLGKTFTEMSGASGASNHATNVGKRIYGLETSVAPGIVTIYDYEAGGWATDDYLRSNFSGAVPPLTTPGGIRLFNNSWIGSFGNVSSDHLVLRRADYVAERDDLLILSGVNNSGSNQPLMAYSFNGLSVGLQNGNHVSGPVPGAYEGAGRWKPEIVAPAPTTSNATGTVSSVAALVVETAMTHPALADEPTAQAGVVLRCVLLGGADHKAGWTNNPATGGENRGVTTLPLDLFFGLGTVHIDRSHMLFTGGRQAGGSTPGAPGNTTWSGWDHAETDEGGGRYWKFTVPEDADEVAITATWNRVVTSTFSGYAMADFDLELFRLDDAGDLVSLVGDAGLGHFASGNVASRSTGHNIEHLWIEGLVAGTYVLELKLLDATGAGSWVAAVGWLFPETDFVPGDVNGDGVVDVSDLLAIIAAWGPCKGCPEDLDGNGSVDVNDILLVLAFWS